MPEMTLLEIQERFLRLNAALEETGGEITPGNEVYFDELFKAVEENEAAEVAKVDGYCVLLDNLDRRNIALKAREEIFRAERKVNEKKIDNLYDRLKEYGIRTGRLTLSVKSEVPKKKGEGTKIETVPGKKIETVPHGFKVSIQYAGTAKLFVDEAAEIPDEYLTYKAPEINREAIAAAINEGKELSFAHFEERAISLVIK